MSDSKNKYDPERIRSQINDWLEDQGPCGDPITGEGYECLVTDSKWKEWKCSYRIEQDRNVLVKTYRCLKEFECFRLATFWLEVHYGVCTFEFLSGHTGGQEWRDKLEATFHLSALSRVLGHEKLREHEEHFCEYEIRPKLGLQAYEVFMHGSEEEILAFQKERWRFVDQWGTECISAGVPARLTGRAVYDHLLRNEKCKDLLISYEERQIMITLTINDAKIVFNLEGFLVYCPGRDIGRGCTWIELSMWRQLENVLSRVCDTEICLNDCVS